MWVTSSEQGDRLDGPGSRGDPQKNDARVTGGPGSTCRGCCARVRERSCHRGGQLAGAPILAERTPFVQPSAGIGAVASKDAVDILIMLPVTFPQPL